MLRFEVFERDAFTCQYCGQHAPNVQLEVDHVVPVAEGGGNTKENLITSCWACNRGKGHLWNYRHMKKKRLTDQGGEGAVPGNKERVLEWLKEHGQGRTREINEGLNLPGDTASVYLRRLRKKGEVTNQNGVWTSVLDMGTSVPGTKGQDNLSM